MSGCTDVPRVLSSQPRKSACERLAELHPGCACEQESVEPALFPGIVEPWEMLARFVPELDFDAEAQVVKPSLFSHSGTAGMSVTRMERIEPSEFVEQCQSTYRCRASVNLVEMLLHIRQFFHCIWAKDVGDQA
jgi:hypothetical protein